jgi:predicted 3-demethylubiquinone-9 3-methyltransferase (glyoxalase superfamily)
MQKITPFLWFENSLTEVIDYYQNIFNYNGQNNFEQISYKLLSDDPDNRVEMAKITLFGVSYHLMNTRRPDAFNHAMSLMINTVDQTETDHYWDAFTVEGSESDCGWCKDKYGLSWQITPNRLFELMSDPDPEVVGRAMQAMIRMQKIVIADLEK